MNIRVVTPCPFEPVSLAEAKLHLRVDAADDDALITALIAAAREYAEGESWRTFMPAVLERVMDAWPIGIQIMLPRPPLRSVESIKWIDASGVEQTVSAGDYIVDAVSEPGRVAPRHGLSWPSGELAPVGAIRVRFVAGVADTLAGNAAQGLIDAARARVSERHKAAIKLLVGHFYENREQTISGTPITDLPFGISNLLMPDRAFEF